MVDKLNQENSYLFKFNKLKIYFLFIFLFQNLWAQNGIDNPVEPKPPVESTLVQSAVEDEYLEDSKEPVKILAEALPNKRRIRRHLSLIKGVKIDEEILIPSQPLKILPVGQTMISIARIKNSDIFRIEPLAAASGIVTLHNKKTGQIYAELHLDIRDSAVDKAIRDLKALLIDIEGLEFKAVNGGVVIDGYVMLPQDLNRLGSVITTYGQTPGTAGGAAAGTAPIAVKSLVTLSPVARKRIVDYIAREINNPEVTITVVGDYIKLEGTVNSQEEKTRVQDLVAIYLPASVTNTNMGGVPNLLIKDRSITGGAGDYILNLINVRKAEDKEEPPEKMIQIVVHFVEFSERYAKNFKFDFQPIISTTSALQLNTAQQSQNSIDSLAALVQNIFPKIQWGKTHGFLKVLDTASVLTENKGQATIARTLSSKNSQNGAVSSVSVSVKPEITQPRAGLVKLGGLVVSSTTTGDTLTPTTNISTTITVRDRQSAAFGGVISKSSSNDYGIPTDPKALLTLSAGKGYRKDGGNFVVFVTPIIKSSASAGVEQVKKKFRLKE